MIGRYRPPALRALASGGSPPNDVSPSTTITPTDSSSLPTNTYSSGYRRARAGTLPSNVSLAAQQYAASNTPSPSTFPSTESFSEQLQLLPQSSATPPASMRPALRHSTSVASTVASSVLTERSSRLRSGSLTTLPSTSLSNPFGGNIFSSSWLASSGNNTSFANNSSFPVLEERSLDHGADDFDVHTLDYLGLDETYHRPPPAATISELRNQAQAVIAGNLSNPPRMRATTVSHPYRRMSSAGIPLLPTTNAEEEEEVYEQQYGHQGLDAYSDSLNPDNYFPRTSKGLKQTDYLSANLVTSRPRAISVGTLDDPARITRRATVSVEQPVYDLASSFNGTNSAQLNQPGILKSDKSSTLRAGASPTVRFPVTEVSGSRAPSYLLTPNQPGRAVSPKSENPAQIQTPTRSLWIGNLDSSVTSEQLIHVFAPYGAIESLRLLPEKVRLKTRPYLSFLISIIGVWLRQLCGSSRCGSCQGRRA
jgi:protein JSN1